ncbi:MAG: glycosyltransferase family 2 protein [Calditrichota bacterium]
MRRLRGEAEFEIMVVDNASTDGSVELIENEFPEVILIKSARNLGFAAALNRGFERALGEFYFILNPDTLVPPNSVRKLLSFLDNNSSVGIVGAQLTYLDGNPQDSTFRFPSLPREFLNYLPEIKAILQPRRWAGNVCKFITNKDIVENRCEPFVVDCVSGAALLVRRDVVKQLNGFDDGFFVYHEERDFCRRAWTAGWEVWSIPTAQVIHLEAQGTGYQRHRLPNFPVLQWRIAGMDRLWWKHGSPIRHNLWRMQTRGLLRLRRLPLLLVLPFCGKHKSSLKARIQELKKVIHMLYQKPVGRCERPE